MLPKSLRTVQKTVFILLDQPQESFFKRFQVKYYLVGHRYYIFIDVDKEEGGSACHQCWLYDNNTETTLSLRAHSAPASIMNAIVDACCMIGWGLHWMEVTESVSPTSLCVSADDSDGCTMFASSDQVYRAH